MRTTLITTLSVLVAGTAMYGLVQANVFRSGCSYPLTYQVGSIDSEFSVATSTVKDVLSDAEQAWEENTDKELFRYDPSGGHITVDFVYDKRQQRTETKNQLSDDLSTLAETHDGLTENLKTKRSRYQQIVENYQTVRRQYEASLEDYNQRVERLNRQGRISSGTRAELDQEKQRLSDVRASLQQTRESLLSLRSEINSLTDEANRLAEEYNQAANTFESRFGTTSEFSQATYESNTITVYQFEQADDLRLALAHELGHALGIDHVGDPQAVMYRLMDQQPLDDITLTAADQKALKETCRL